ncbi:hypothetical protein ACWIEX_05965 [Bosea sp. NPDC055353]
MTDHDHLKVPTTYAVSIKMREDIKAAAKEFGLSQSAILSQATAEWLASRRAPIPLPEFKPQNVTYADITEPKLVLVLPRDQIKGDGQ